MTLGEFKNDNGMGWHEFGFTLNSIHFSPHSSKSNDVDQNIIKPQSISENDVIRVASSSFENCNCSYQKKQKQEKFGTNKSVGLSLLDSLIFCASEKGEKSFCLFALGFVHVVLLLSSNPSFTAKVFSLKVQSNGLQGPTQVSRYRQSCSRKQTQSLLC